LHEKLIPLILRVFPAVKKVISYGVPKLLRIPGQTGQAFHFETGH